MSGVAAGSILVVVAKRPVPGAVKTRLTPALSPADACRLYEALLLDVLDQTARVAPGRIEKAVAVTPPESLDYFRGVAPAGFRVFAQEGPGLAERLSAIFARLCGEGFGKVVVRNSDSPLLPAEYLEAAFARLDGCDAVFGPDGGGGYNLVGLRAPRPELFLGITMSTSSVIDETLARARDARLRVALLPVGRDVDEPEDLAWLAEELRRDGGDAAERIPRTARALRALGRG